MAMKKTVSLPTDRNLRRFVEVLHQTGDAPLAYMAMRPHGRRETAEKRGPELAAHPKVNQMLEDLEGMPEGMSDDERMAHHALSLADDEELSPRERLQAMQTYSKLKRAAAAEKQNRDDARGWAPELVAFLEDQGVEIDL